ncbi:MAG: AraC family transcriptional regulator, partial [Bacteroidota bacterium]
MINIICVLPPSVHLLDMAGPVHIFYEANQYGGEYNLIYTSIETDTDDIRTSSGLSLHRLQSFTTLPPAANNTILLPGADFPILQNYAYGRARSFYQWLTQQYASGARICSVCTGAWLLGEAGLLNGRSYTTHWNYTSVFRERFPKATLVNDRFFVSDQRIISSAGVSSGIDLALHLVEIDTSTHIATQVAREAVIYRRRGPADPQLSVFLAYRNHIDDRIHSAQNFIIENMQRQLRSEEIAQHV